MRVLRGLQRTTQKKAVAEGVMRCHLDLDLRGATDCSSQLFQLFTFQKKNKLCIHRVGFCCQFMSASVSMHMQNFSYFEATEGPLLETFY